jgi:hypothetical protein
MHRVLVDGGSRLPTSIDDCSLEIEPEGSDDPGVADKTRMSAGLDLEDR